jgi:hypothetical protein
MEENTCNYLLLAGVGGSGQELELTPAVILRARRLGREVVRRCSGGAGAAAGRGAGGGVFWRRTVAWAAPVGSAKQEDGGASCTARRRRQAAPGGASVQAGKARRRRCFYRGVGARGHGAHAPGVAPSWSPGLARHGHGAGPEWALAGLAAGPERTGSGGKGSRVGPNPGGRTSGLKTLGNLSGLAKYLRGRWWTSDRWAGIDRTGEEEKSGVVRQISKIGLEA